MGNGGKVDEIWGHWEMSVKRYECCRKRHALRSGILYVLLLIKTPSCLDRNWVHATRSTACSDGLIRSWENSITPKKNEDDRTLHMHDTTTIKRSNYNDDGMNASIDRS